jgi:thymidine kinase
MFSGKTEELIRLVRRSMHARKIVQVFKSSLDTRCDTTVIRTHDDTQFNAIGVPDAASIESLLLPGVQVVGIEEVQFLDEPVVELCVRLADSGIHVIVAGLDQDFRGMPFTFMPKLMALADDVMKLHAICKVCGEEASRTQRLVDGRPASWDEPTILIGADETYEARCRGCHVVRDTRKGCGPVIARKHVKKAPDTANRTAMPGVTMPLSASPTNVEDTYANHNGHSARVVPEPAALNEPSRTDTGQLDIFTES